MIRGKYWRSWSSHWRPDDVVVQPRNLGGG